MENFVTGDVVYLKSGGPGMTVVSSDTAGVLVNWFEGEALVEDTFCASLLTKDAD